MILTFNQKSQNLTLLTLTSALMKMMKYAVMKMQKNQERRGKLELTQKPIR